MNLDFKIYHCRRCRKQFSAESSVVTILDGEAKKSAVTGVKCPICNREAHKDFKKPCKKAETSVN